MLIKLSGAQEGKEGRKEVGREILLDKRRLFETASKLRQHSLQRLLLPNRFHCVPCGKGIQRVGEKEKKKKGKRRCATIFFFFPSSHLAQNS